MWCELSVAESQDFVDDQSQVNGRQKAKGRSCLASPFHHFNLNCTWFDTAMNF